MSVPILIAIVLAFVANLILTPIIIRVCHRHKWYDHPSDRKVHVTQTPRLGGPGIFLSFTLSILILAFLLPQITQDTVAHFFPVSNISLLVGFLLVHLIGLVDDFHNIPAVYKLLGQILAGILVVLGGAFIDSIYLPLVQLTVPLGSLSGAITIFWLISVSNAVNLFDGMDGLAGGTALIAAGGIAVVHIIMGNITGALYSSVLFGSVLAFLIFNRPPAQLFMGDSGSLFLGFALASLAFIGADNSPVRVEHFHAGFIITTTVLIVPIVDLFAAILRRRREGRPIYQADKEHYHHKLLSFGLSVWSILAITTVINLIMVGIIVAYSLLFLQEKTLLGDVLLVSGWGFVVLLFIVLHYVNKKHKQGLATQHDQ